MRLRRYFFVKKPRYEMKAAVSKMSPHNFLSCCLKFCTASVHLTLSEASPPTYHSKEQRGEKTRHTTGYRATIQPRRRHGTRFTAGDSGHHLHGPSDQWGGGCLYRLQRTLQSTSPCSLLCVTWAVERQVLNAGSQALPLTGVETNMPTSKGREEDLV